LSRWGVEVRNFKVGEYKKKHEREKKFIIGQKFGRRRTIPSSTFRVPPNTGSRT